MLNFNTMTPEEKSLLERTYKLAEENNTILKSIRRTNRFSTAVKITYWAIILIISFGAYYLIQPYVTALMSAFGTQATTPGAMNLDINQVQNAAKSLQELLK